jgi:MFS family permease
MRRDLTNIPFSPAKSPIFYGWVVLAAGTLGLLMSMPGQTIGVGAFNESLQDALGLSEEQLTRAYMFGTGISGLLLTFAGKLYDRWGARVVAALAAVGLGGMLVLCSQSDRIASSLVAATGIGPQAGAFAVILVGFFGIRFCGQGVLTVASRNMVMEWFDRHRGLANGIMGVSVQLGFNGGRPLLGMMVVALSWRVTWIVLAVIVGGVFSLLVLVFYRDNPEDAGLQPDGSLHEDEHAVAARLAHRQFTLGEAARTYSFWIFALAMGMFGLYMTALSFLVEPIYAEAGMDKLTAEGIFFSAALIAIPLHFLAGWVSDYVPLKYVLIVMLAGLVTSMAAMTALNPTTRWVMIVGNGVLTGMFGVVSAVTWPRFYGREHLGAISGLTMAITVVASAIGPWTFSLAKTITGSYAPAAGICLGVTVALLVAALLANNPQPKKPSIAVAEE